MQLGDAYAQNSNHSQALKTLNFAQQNINLKSEPELGATYYFTKGQWLAAVNKRGEALAAFLETERIMRNIRLEPAYHLLLCAYIYHLNNTTGAPNDYYEKKIRSFMHVGDDIEGFVKEVLEKSKKRY